MLFDPPPNGYLIGFIGLPPWATKFIEMVLMLTADHGPAVSGYASVTLVIGGGNADCGDIVL